MNLMQVDLRRADARTYAAINTFNNILQAERFPDEPPFPLDPFVSWCRNMPASLERVTWIIRSEAGTALLGIGHVDFWQREDNQHAGFMELAVLPEHRRHGLGRQLLGRLAESTRAVGRQVLICSTFDHVPAGERFMERAGAQVGLEMHINQLRMDELDRALLQRWQAPAREDASAFELGLWDGPYPEDQLEAIAELMQLINQAPRDNLAMEDMRIRPQHIRELERSSSAAGNQLWTMYVRQRSSGRLAGYSMVFWNPARPALLDQGMTGVWPEFRGRGLGRWLKAAMLDRVLRERPQVQVVRTGNAHSNAPMLKINFELGFRPHSTMRHWQLETAQALAYVQSRSQAGALAAAP